MSLIQEPTLQTPPPRCRQNDGAGKSSTSWQKHFLIERALKAQLAKLDIIGRRPGVIVDMHAHDGTGVHTPQRGLWSDACSTSSAAVAMHASNRYNVDLILCEKNADRREQLMLNIPRRAVCGQSTEFFSDNRQLLEVDWKRYGFAVVLNDPNGPSEHALDVMQHVATQQGLKADFLIVVNDGALRRNIGHKHSSAPIDMTKPNSAAVMACRQKAASGFWDWMQDPMQWAARLHRREVAWSTHRTTGKGFQAHLLVVTNSLANLNVNEFTTCKS